MKQEVKLGFEIRTLDNMLRRNFISSVKESGLDEVTVMHGWIIGYLYKKTSIRRISSLIFPLDVPR